MKSKRLSQLFLQKSTEPTPTEKAEDIIFLQTIRVVPTLSACIKQLSVTFSDRLYFLLSSRQVTFLLEKSNKYRDSSTLYTGSKRKGNRTTCYERPGEDIHLSPPSFFFFVPTTTYQPRLALVPSSNFHAQYFYIYFFPANQICCYKPRTSPARKLKYRKILYEKKPKHPIEIETVHTLCVHRASDRKLEEQKGK